MSGVVNEVKIDESVLPIVAIQQAGESIRRAIQKADHHEYDEALLSLERTARELTELGRPDLVKDGLDAIVRTIHDLKEGLHRGRNRKKARYRSRTLRKGSSKERWSGDESERPSFKDTNQ